MTLREPRRELLRAAGLFYQRGWMAGTAGNLSVRADDKSFWITASGCSKGELTLGDLIRVSLTGEVLERARASQRPSAETSIHRLLYVLRPEVGAVYHVHTIESCLLASLHPRSIPLPALEMLKGFGLDPEGLAAQVPVIDNHREVDDIAGELEALLRGDDLAVPAMVIAAHGLTTWAATPLQCLHQVELLDYMFRYAIAARSIALPR